MMLDEAVALLVEQRDEARRWARKLKRELEDTKVESQHAIWDLAGTVLVREEAIETLSKELEQLEADRAELLAMVQLAHANSPVRCLWCNEINHATDCPWLKWAKEE